MTKRKLRGPASVRNKEKKSKPDVSDPPENALEDQSKPEEDTPQPPATILKEEGQAALLADENNILERMAQLEEEMEQESADVTGDEGNKDDANSQKRSEEDLIQERLIGLNDFEEEDAGDDDKLKQLKSNSEENEENRNSEENMNEAIKTMLTQKDKKIKSLEGKIRSLEAEKAELSTKYKKYKEMAVKLTKEKGASKGSGGGNKELEEENQELKMKLRSVLDDLKDKEESKGDVSSKLSLKDHLLQQQIIKNEELELKFKNFLMKFHEKFSKGGGGSLTENASSILTSSLQESKVQEHLSNTAKTVEVPKRALKPNSSTNVAPNVPIPSPKTAEPGGNKVDEFKESLESRLTKVQKSTSEDKEPISNKNPNNKSVSKKVIASKPATKAPDGEKGVDRTSKKSQASVNLNNSLPIPSATRGPASRRQSLATAAPREPEKPNKEPAVTKTQASSVPNSQAKPDKNLPSKLLANSSISIGRKEKPIPKGISVQKSSSPMPSSASAKLSKLSGLSMSVSSSPSNPAPTPKVNLPPSSSISMTKSATAVAGNETKGKGTPNTSKLLKNSGISFSKVSTDAAAVPKSPVSKPAPPTKSLSSLKGLNISLSKPAGEEDGRQSSERGVGALTAAKQTSLSRSLALVPAEDQEEDEEPKSPVPSKSTQAKKRGPTNAKRKPLPQSNKLSFAKKVPKEITSDEQLLDEGSGGGESLSLTFQEDEDNESEAHSVSIPVEDNILKELSFNSALDMGSLEGTGGGESISYESLLSRVSSELDSITKTNKQDKEKILLQSDEKLLL